MAPIGPAPDRRAEAARIALTNLAYNRVGVPQARERTEVHGGPLMATTAGRQPTVMPVPRGRHRRIQVRAPHRRATGLRLRVIAVMPLHRVTAVRRRLTARMRLNTRRRAFRAIPRHDPTQFRVRVFRLPVPRQPREPSAEVRAARVLDSREDIRAAEAADAAGRPSNPWDH